MNGSANNTALVSILIPAYNCASTISATIDSCLSQTYENVEVIVVNDGSRDDTAEVLRSFGDRIRFVDKANGGVASGRNAGLRMARGEFIALMDHDDLMMPDRIMLQAGVLSGDATVQLVSSDFSAFVNDGDADFEASHMHSYYSAPRRLGGIANIYPIVVEIGKFGHKVTVRKGDVYVSLLGGNFVHPPTIMFRRSLLDHVAPFDEKIRINCDYDFILRAARCGMFAYIDAALLRYRRSDTQLSHTAKEAIALEIIMVLEKVQRENPEIYRAHKDLFRRRYAELFIDVACMLGPIDRPRAFKMLRRGLSYKFLPRAGAFALSRIVVPRFVVRAGKSLFRLMIPR